MSNRPPRKPNSGGRRRGGGARSGGARGGVTLKRSADGRGWLLSHPAGVRERADDLEEVRAMLDAGEIEVAVDELRWLLSGCGEMIEAHFLLGKLAVETDGDVELGRGHFGFGFQLGERAWRRAGEPHPMPALHPANRAFFDCGRGLAWCLRELGKRELALEVLAKLRAADPSDPLGLAGWVDELATADTPLVPLATLFTPRDA